MKSVAVSVLVWCLLLTTVAFGQESRGTALQGAPAKSRWPTLASTLHEVADLALQSTTLAANRARQQFRLSRDGRIPVTVRVTDARAVETFLVARGLVPANRADDTIEVYADPGTIVALAALSAVRRVEDIVPPKPLVTSQGVTVHNAANWQSYGYTGTGVKIGVIDVGFVGYGGLVGTELPAPAGLRCYSAVGTYSAVLSQCETLTQHGTGVAETFVDVAPGAQVYIANPFSRLDMQQTVAWMVSQGVSVINFSAAWTWDGPGDGTSPFSDSPLKAVDSAVSGGAVFVAAAGNEGQATWYGGFVDTNANDFLEFGPGDECNDVWLETGEPVAVQMRWSDSWTAASMDLDLGLYNASLSLVASSTDYQDGTPGRVPFELLTYTAPAAGYYCIGVLKYPGAMPAWVQVQSFFSQPLQHHSSGYSIGNPAESANAGMLAAGAAAWSTTSTIEPFSSRGPTPDGRTKPEVVGADRADTVTYGAGGFAGTSQASPHVAGLAALVKQAFPSYPPAQIASYLRYYALARGAVPNDTWGYGFAALPTIGAGPVMALDRTSMQFGAVTSGGTFLSQTSAQTVRLTQTGAGTVTWTAAPSHPWIQVTPTSGTGGATLTISVVADAGLPASGSVAGAVVLSFSGAGNSPGPINVTLELIPAGTSASPFGVIDTPLPGATGVSGSIPVTGWALDDLEVTRVQIFRDAVSPEPAGAMVYIGEAVAVEGARPDVQLAYPGYPLNSRAGWGYMLLTNMLPNQGNGVFTLHAYADDVEGHRAWLGSRTFTGDNANATRPFGAIDTPGQGATVTGSSYVNFGWALTPGTCTIPFDGSTITVVVDGVAVGHPGALAARDDIEALFPSYTNTEHAVGAFFLDTTAYANGVHTIAWGVTDDCGRADGIGSRYFTVFNASGPMTATSASTAPLAAGPAASEMRADAMQALRDRGDPVWVRLGADEGTPFARVPYANGTREVVAHEVERVVVRLAPPQDRAAGWRYDGHLVVGAALRPLPVGSTLDRAGGVFSWQPGVGFVGAYDLLFTRTPATGQTERLPVRVVLTPKHRSVSDVRVAIDVPGAGEVAQPFLVAGWAIDRGAVAGTGVDTVHVWAYPVTAAGYGAPSFLGVARYGDRRGDVGAYYGGHFAASAYGLVVNGLAPGTYDLAVFAYSAVTGRFAPARVVRVTVR